MTWSPDGSELFHRRLDGRRMAASFSEQGGRPVIGRPVELFGGPYVAALPNAPREYHVAPDVRFLMIKETTGTSEEPQVVLVWNFFEELKRRVPN